MRFAGNLGAPLAVNGEDAEVKAADDDVEVARSSEPRSSEYSEGGSVMTSDDPLAVGLQHPVTTPTPTDEVIEVRRDADESQGMHEAPNTQRVTPPDVSC